ncbi:FtsX-like permease family protein [Priestia megaterium]|uniref:FtsX-like permease family protein n=1 Tax=Priestia megaterium TaxID=1404 RepID=UPI003CFD4CBB
MTFNNLVLKNVLRDKWTYIAYFVSSIFSIFIFFSFSVSMFHPKLAIIKYGSTLSMTMIAGNILVYLFSFIFISFSVMSFIKVKQKNLGLFMIMGASNKQIKKIVFRENMFIGFVAIIVAILLGILFAPLSLMLTQKVMDVNQFTMYFPLKAIVLTFVMFSILFLLISCVSPYFIRKQKVIDLIKSKKKPEKEMKFSPILLFIGFVAVIGSLVCIMGNVSWVKNFIESTLGTFVLFFIFIGGLYILYMHLYLLIINLLQRKNAYLRKTNMLIISGLRAKSRTNVKMMYLVTLLLTGSFFSIIMLYSANVNVKDITQVNIPYSYIYTSDTSNPVGEKHVQLIEKTLEKKGEYKAYKFPFAYNSNDRKQAFISQSSYNRAVKGFHKPSHKPSLSLEQNEIFIVNGMPKEKIQKEIPAQVKNIFKKANIKAKVIGVSNQNILPSGYVPNLFVVSDEQFKQYAQLKDFRTIDVFAYNVDSWEKDIKTAQILEQKLSNSEHSNYGFFSQGSLYDSEKNMKNLMFYVGFMIGLIFIIAAVSIIYFQLITDIEKEREKYRGIRKMGLSKGELSQIVSRQLVILLFVPFTLATIFLGIGVEYLKGLIGDNLADISLLCFGIFFIIQLTGYFLLKTKYVKSLLKGM